MQTFIIVLEDGCAFCLARVVFGVGVCDVAGEDFLPEGEAAGGAWGFVLLVSKYHIGCTGSCDRRL
jgi:hypothetical protein